MKGRYLYNYVTVYKFLNLEAIHKLLTLKRGYVAGNKNYYFELHERFLKKFKNAKYIRFSKALNIYKKI
jgi:hypothetical protein